MKTAGSDRGEKPACAVKRSPVPQVLECPGCEDHVEIWSDEDDTVCSSCGQTVTRGAQ